MTIIFAGGRCTNRSNPADAPLVLDDGPARAAVWRDFHEGLSPGEQAYFSPPDADGEIGVTPDGGAARAAMGPHQSVRERNRDEPVAMLIDAIRDRAKQYYLMPIPVYQAMPPTLQWVTNSVIGRSRGMRIFINGYGNFPTEWVGTAALGRTHRASRRSNRDACIYATRFVGANFAQPIRERFERGWVLSGRRRGDTFARWVDREDTASLFHELLGHMITGRPHPAGNPPFTGLAAVVENFNDAVERRARQNFRRNHAF